MFSVLTVIMFSVLFISLPLWLFAVFVYSLSRTAPIITFNSYHHISVSYCASSAIPSSCEPVRSPAKGRFIIGLIREASWMYAANSDFVHGQYLCIVSLAPQIGRNRLCLTRALYRCKYCTPMNWHIHITNGLIEVPWATGQRHFLDNGDGSFVSLQAIINFRLHGPWIWIVSLSPTQATMEHSTSCHEHRPFGDSQTLMAC